jgi:predicted 3-demethylubiquinone-9 3-methyltransferase (glyoxalase superfamily)
MSEEVSIQVFCETQAEIDGYWEKLSEGADPGSQQGGCLTDRYGVQWQVLPRRLIELLKDEASPQARRTREAIESMTKIDIAALERAAVA